MKSSSSPPTFDTSPPDSGRLPEIDLEARFEALAGLIGRTPLLGIRVRFRGRELEVFAKHEAWNHTGSIKDRMALGILREAYATGAIHPGDTIAEATSGNTGISFAALGRALGHPVRIYMPDWMSRERVLLIQSLAAAVIPNDGDDTSEDAVLAGGHTGGAHMKPATDAVDRVA